MSQRQYTHFAATEKFVFSLQLALRGKGHITADKSS